MTDRTSPHHADPFERALLESTRLDEPDAAALRRTALVLGVGGLSLAASSSALAATLAQGGAASTAFGGGATVAGTIATVAGSGTAAAASGVVASGAATTVGGAAVAAGAKVGVGVALWVKPLVIGAALGGFATTTVQVLTRPAEQAPAAQSVRAPAQAAVGEKASSRARGRARLPSASPLALEPPVADAQALAAPVIAPAPSAAPPAGALRRGAAAPTVAEAEPPAVPALTAPALTAPAPAALAPATTGAPPSIADEISAMDRARALLRAGRPVEASSVLEAYRARWPAGVFSIEATVLRIEARYAAGDRAHAEAEARAFIDAHGNSRYASRLRALVSGR